LKITTRSVFQVSWEGEGEVVAAACAVVASVGDVDGGGAP
jgi:hypothetical protein